MRNWLALSWIVVAASSCAGPAKHEPLVPAQPSSTAPAVTAPAPADAARPDPLVAVPPVPATCAVLVEHPVGTSCHGGKAGAVAALDEALAQGDTEQRDARLAGLEGCPDFPRGLVRALRAELAPAPCSDALVEPVLTTATPQSVRRDVKETLEGLRLAGKLARLVLDPPKLAEPFDKAAFNVYLRDQLKPWIIGQARAIEALSLQGSRLHGYAKGVVAVEAGLADMRFVEVVRAIPLPKEMAEDPQVKDTYYGSLDQELEPRKDRGRDAALVGLGEFARAGILRDPRLDRARSLLSKLYGGRRIDALDGLLLPMLDNKEPGSVDERLASRLPTFYLPFVLDNLDPTRPAMLRALLDRGAPPAVQEALSAAKLPPEARALHARLLVELGRRYWRSEDFARAADTIEADRKGTEAGELLGALAVALKGGPKNAAEMMVRGISSQSVANVAELDALAGKAKAPIAGFAAYDAAYLLQIAPPGDADKKYWQQIAKRYRRAAKLLSDAAHKAEATQRAKAAEATANAIR